MCSALRSDPRDDAGLRVTIAGNAHAIRQALADLVTRPPLAGLCPADRGSAEIVLAEILNNIAEHAYAGRDGPIEICLSPEKAGIACTIADIGIGMPGGQLPHGDLNHVSEVSALSEGGYGWFLIRSLTADLHYHRRRNRNELRFRIVAGQ